MPSADMLTISTLTVTPQTALQHVARAEDEPRPRAQAHSTQQATYEAQHRETSFRRRLREGMPVTVNAKKAAEDLKKEGNALFTREKYAAALDKYTEAITIAPDIAALYVNRALCHRKRGNAQQTLEDAEHALELDSSYMKAHFLCGWALTELQQWDRAVKHLLKALEAARALNDSIKDDIWKELARASYSRWQAESQKRSQERQQLHAILNSLLDKQANESAAAAEIPGMLQEDGLEGGAAQHQALSRQLDSVFKDAAKRDAPAEVPSAYVCPLTMEVFRDPVITPAGHSYERGAILEHLRKLGEFDPISRDVRVTVASLTSNLGLRAAVQHYLEEHPWAWAECR